MNLPRIISSTLCQRQTHSFCGPHDSRLEQSPRKVRGTERGEEEEGVGRGGEGRERMGEKKGEGREREGRERAGERKRERKGDKGEEGKRKDRREGEKGEKKGWER